MPSAIILGFDFGEKRIGVAIGYEEVKIATPLMTIEFEDNQSRFEAISKLIKEWSPAKLIVGLPVHADGAEHEMTKRSRRFGRQLEGRFKLPVIYVDERFTSLIAEEMLREVGNGGQREKGNIDCVAAQVIVQSYLDSLLNETGATSDVK